jgi:hypothetical protein
MSRDPKDAVENSRNDNSLKLSKAKGGNSWKSKSISLMIMKHQVAATRIHPGFL